MNDKLLKGLYDEFGKERVNITRRELTIKNGEPPSYIELYASLSLANGWQTPPIEPGDKRRD